jgi:anti-sigma factor RsiW
VSERPDPDPVCEDDLQAHVDGRLEAARDAVVRTWLDRHPVEAARVRAYTAQRDALRSRLRGRYDEPVPPRFHLDVLRQRRRHALTRRLRGVAAGATLLLVGGAGGWFAHALDPVRPMSMLPRAAAAAHRTFVVDVRHPVEVTAAQEGHLVQWLSNRLGRPLRVPDLSSVGFHLMGGRLLPSSAAPAAQLMFDDAKGTRLTVYVRSDPDDGETSFRVVEQDGLSGFFWVDQGFGYAVMAQLPRGQLLTVAEAVWQQLSPAAHALAR